MYLWLYRRDRADHLGFSKKGVGVVGSSQDGTHSPTLYPQFHNAFSEWQQSASCLNPTTPITQVEALDSFATSLPESESVAGSSTSMPLRFHPLNLPAKLYRSYAERRNDAKHF
jgi:hypothetical protein